MEKVDVFINAYGKPFQTALSLISLLKFSGHHIGTIWLTLDRADFSKSLGTQFILDLLPEIKVYEPSSWRWIGHIDPTQLSEPEYRYSIRYQYAWEHSRSRYALIIHNDINVFDDVISFLLGNIGDHLAAGEVGQCWICPASHHKLCSPSRYLEYRPSLREFLSIAKDPRGHVLTDVSNYMVCPSIKRNPWPLPMCRVNEWCVLIDLEKARPLTCPVGKARPFGAHVFEGVIKNIEDNEEYIEFVNNLGIVYDTGIAWFRDIHHMGYTCKNVSLSHHIEHFFGHKALFNSELYEKKEAHAKQVLVKDYNLKFSS